MPAPKPVNGSRRKETYESQTEKEIIQENYQDGLGSGSMIIGIRGKKIILSHFFKSNNGNLQMQEFSAKCKFCPMCGRKLVEE